MSAGSSPIVVDTEWGYRGGRIGCMSAWVPIVFCAIILFSGQEFVFLPGRDERRLADFLNENGDALWVAHSITAEMKYLLHLGMPIPGRWFDTLLAERWLTNSPLRPETSLSKALARRGLSHLVPFEKNEFRRKLLSLDFSPGSGDEMDEIAEYCLQDCRACAALFQRQRAVPDHCRCLDRVMSHWPIYQLAAAKMEMRGIPIDVPMYKSVCNCWPGMRESLAKEVNALAPVMAPSGIKRLAFRRFCYGQGIPLPQVFDKSTRQMRHSIESEALKEIEHYHPAIPLIRQTHKTLTAFRNNKMVVDYSTGRHYFDVRSFATVTGRNAPRQFIFNQSKWMRFLVVPESPDHILMYVDYKAQEIGIAAALSRDQKMMEMYQAEDPHMAFAEFAGAVPKGARKDDYPEIRKKYKTVGLGVLYGLTPEGTARKLGISTREAEELHRAHRRLFPIFWDWSERSVVAAMNNGHIRTRVGWRSLVPPESNARTWANWPMQATGSDIMRLTVMYLDKCGATLLAPVHDGFLISARRVEVPAIQAVVDYACGAAVEHVLPGFRMNWTVTVYEDRFEDPDGLPLWETVQRLLLEQSHEQQG